MKIFFKILYSILILITYSGLFLSIQSNTIINALGYFDINNIVSFLNVPTDFCLALADPICLPEFVYSAYAHINAPKEIHLYPFAPHYTPDEYDLLVHTEFSEL